MSHRCIGLRIIVILLLLALGGCRSGESDSDPAVRQEVQQYLDEYEERYQELYYDASLAEWEANTRIMEGDTATAGAVQRANEALAAFTGSSSNIGTANSYLDRVEALPDLQVRQLRSIIYRAANNPQVVDSLVSERIRLENELNNRLFGFEFTIDARPVSTNEIDRILRESNDLAERRRAWEASKEVGRELKDGLAEVRGLRNRTVDAMGFRDYFSYQVYDYGMSPGQMMELMQRVRRELFPLYRELHTWARYELAERYGEDVPEMLPAHWLPNRWGQDWSSLVREEEGGGLEEALANRSAEDLVRMAEQFYVSLGFDSLPASFYERSSLYPLPPTADYSKNNHASAWHLDLDRDVRSLMSVEPTPYWYETTHHELGHIYYYLSYSNPDVPLLLRQGANRAFHEAVGSLMGLASMQEPYLRATGMLADGPAGDDAAVDAGASGEAAGPGASAADTVVTSVASPEEIRALLREALNYVVFIPFSAGVMSRFEHDLYRERLPGDSFNNRWWELKRRYQGIVPPSERGSQYADAASKTHIINDAAQYYDYALSNLILFQLHTHIAGEILEQTPHATNYYASAEVGDFLRKLMRPGATVDWQELIRETTGSEISARPMADYFEPLMEWLREQNRGRTHTLASPD